VLCISPGRRSTRPRIMEGKWDSAIPVVQILVLSLPIKLVVPLYRSLMEGRDEWKFVSILLLADGNHCWRYRRVAGRNGASTVPHVQTSYVLAH
jgi:hypothetical protein